MFPHRASTVLLQLGLLAVVLAALPYKLFELDRYFVPKEAVLHLVALLVALLLAREWRRERPDATERLLLAFLAWSALSALFATNHWLAQRALGVSVSGVVVFLAARVLASQGRHRPLIHGTAWAGVCAAALALAQAYGVESDYFSLNRAPGGTFGNRNSVAHVAAITLPAVAWSALAARTRAGSWSGIVAVTLLAGALVLTRSRAAWLAVAASGVAALIPLLASRRYWNGLPVWRRLFALGGAAALGVGLAIVLPNALRWRSDSPYLDSARAVVDYSSGSGRGRLAQYRTSLGMLRDDPVFGAGPGNWPVRYVAYAPAGDPSLAADGMTANPWPSSDWVAFLSERGAVGLGLVAAAFVALFFGAMRGWASLRDGPAVLAKVTLVATIAAAVVVSTFDAALLLASPGFLAWCTMGAMSGVGRAEGAGALAQRVAPASGTGRWRWAALAALIVTIALSLARSAAQVKAILTVGTGGTRAAWLAAMPWDPGSYRITLRAAQLLQTQGRCAAARTAARRAQSLFPHAAAPRRIIRSCSQGVARVDGDQSR